MNQTDELSLAELYPEGRHFYYEGDDPAEFLALIAETGGAIDLRANVPPDRLEAFYAALDRTEIRVGT